MQRVTLIDNYDSFTFNLAHYLGELGADVSVWRNDEITVAEAVAQRPDAIVLSPGPCTPNEAGVCLDLIRAASATTPILGVCLGHQAIGQAFGGEVVRAPAPMHGKLSRISHNARGLFRGINGPFQATRYHSLVIERATAPDELEISAESDDGLIMGVAHRARPVYGVQFHPESIASEHGHLILRNFLDLAAAFHARVMFFDERRAEVMESFKPLIAKVAAGATFSRAEAAAAFDAMLSGEVTPSQMGGFLMALRVRGESVEEITGAVTAMRAKMLARRRAGRRDRHRRHRRRRFGLLQCLDAGRDHRRRLRRSGRQAWQSRGLVAVRRRRYAGRARRQDRHRRRKAVERCIREAGIGFMMAPTHHAAMRHVGPTRVELGTRTIFNLLGPLSNPAGVRRQLIGVFSASGSRRWRRCCAISARNASGSPTAATGSTKCPRPGRPKSSNCRTAQFAPSRSRRKRRVCARASRPSSRAATPAHNAAALLAVLEGATTPIATSRCSTPAGALVVADKAARLAEGVG